MCRGYADRLRHQKELVWLQASLVGSLFSTKGLPSLSDLTGSKLAVRHQDPREMDLMLDLFAHQAKQLQKAAN